MKLQSYGWCEQALAITSATDLVSICFISLSCCFDSFLHRCVIWWIYFLFFFHWQDMHTNTMTPRKLVSMRLFLSVQSNSVPNETMNNNNNDKRTALATVTHACTNCKCISMGNYLLSFGYIINYLSFSCCAIPICRHGIPMHTNKHVKCHHIVSMKKTLTMHFSLNYNNNQKTHKISEF